MSGRIADRFNEGISTKLAAKYEYSRKRSYFPEGAGIQQGLASCFFLFDSYGLLGGAVGTAGRGYDPVTSDMHVLTVIRFASPRECRVKPGGRKTPLHEILYSVSACFQNFTRV
ncbi:hypothetical protein SAMN05216386_1116 [Nitrosospira briensis]|uniref:Uncharacterized protein n=1 Tax=Nitrosospira briensis TaxID=35799 RepID=A0A1I4ZA78_9PROT|nr:hypothetical protein [Nitrosospira briensis]SFN47194.1 hypothetical protein SAMN05216386_1116 [Nitrosospira briensis]